MDLLINALCVTVGIVTGLIITVILFFKITMWIFGTRARRKMKKTAMEAVSLKEGTKIDNKRN
ncbi:hypothetical protein [Megamonas sp.]